MYSEAHSQHESDLEARNHAAITEARFFEPNHADLHELFMALGRQEQWSDDPRDMLPYIRERWIGSEHGNSTAKDQFTADQVAAAMPILGRMGFSAETLPPDGAYFDDVIIVGGTAQANYRRTAVALSAINDHGVTADRITIWAGQRPREARDGTNAELLATEGRFAGADVSQDPWVQMLQSEGRLDEQNPWGLTETDSAIWMLKKQAGRLALSGANLDANTDIWRNPADRVPLPDDVPSRIFESFEFQTDGGQPILVMNAAAVDRGEGRPRRHTTRSCAIEWLENHTPPQGARVLFVSSNPHTLRTAQDTYQVLREMGRGDIQLVVAGASAPGNATIQLFLGEVGRLIDNDVQRNHAPTPTYNFSVVHALGEAIRRKRDSLVQRIVGFFKSLRLFR